MRRPQLVTAQINVPIALACSSGWPLGQPAQVSVLVLVEQRPVSLTWALLTLIEKDLSSMPPRS